MKLEIETQKILNSVIIAGIVGSLTATAGAIYDFRDLKKKVLKHDNQISIMSILQCKQAIKNNIDEAPELCAEIISGHQKRKESQ